MNVGFRAPGRTTACSTTKDQETSLPRCIGRNLKMLPERATFEDGGSGVEAGVIGILDRMQTGRGTRS
jgi:hypothetical protein